MGGVSLCASSVCLPATRTDWSFRKLVLVEAVSENARM